MKKSNTNSSADVAFLDFQKAFDKVSHNILLKKLTALNITGKTLLWISNWLENRKQRVCLEGAYSDWKAVTSGVPQGSVLGPTLFVCFINDIDENISCRITKFADDTKLLACPLETLSGLDLQTNLNKIFEWSETNMMCFNTSKSKIMHVGRKNPQKTYNMINIALTKTSLEKYLGL